MREPSSFSQLYKHHLVALRGEQPDLYDDEIYAGWFKTKQHKNGVWVPARVFVVRDICPDTGELTADESLMLEIEGIVEADPLRAQMKFQYFRPISYEAYKALQEQRQFGPITVDAHKPVDLADHPVFPEGVF